MMASPQRNLRFEEYYRARNSSLITEEWIDTFTYFYIGRNIASL